LHLGLGGTQESPALLDDLIVSRTAPKGKAVAEMLPQPKKDLIYRFAAVGDPQIGFSSYEADMIRFQEAVKQINKSGAEFTLILGDMVHDKEDEKVYQDLKKAADGLKQPCYYIRGNHERKDLYLKHFQP